jgi:hypothetical protein
MMEFPPDIEPRWLFRRGTDRTEPADDEEAVVRELEDRARAVDVLSKEPRTNEVVAEEFAKRRLLLLDMAAAGLFEEPHEADRRSWLERWGCTTLRGYQDAAAMLRRYLVSEERRILIPSSGPVPVVGAPVSLDWFRLGGGADAPKGSPPFKWLAGCEFMADPSAPHESAFGQGYMPVGDVYYAIRWRKDDGEHIALVSALRRPDLR